MPTTQKLLRFEDLDSVCGVRSRATLSRLIRTRGFPPPLKFGGRAAFWRQTDIKKWIDRYASETGEARQ